MRFLLVCLMILGACRSTSGGNSRVQALEDALSLVQLPDGSFLVTCKDGKVSRVPLDEVRTGRLCLPADPIICVEQAGRYFPKRANGAALIGDGGSQPDCERSAQSAREGFICVPKEGSFRAARTWNGSMTSNIGSSWDDCLINLQQANRGLICGLNEGGFAAWSSLFEPRLGSPTDRTTCDLLIKSPGFAAVCGLTPAGNFAPFRFSDGVMLGDPRSLEECRRMAATSKPDVICKGVSGGFVPTSIRTDKAIGQALALDDCARLTESSVGGAVCSADFGVFWPSSAAAGIKLGDGGVDQALCLNLVKSSRQGVVCSLRAGGFLPTRLADGQQLFEGMSADDCQKATAAARNGFVCSAQGGAFAPTSIAKGERIGAPGSLDQCIANLPAQPVL